MIDTIKIKIDKDHKFICNSYVISRVDENKVSQFEITFDESLINNWAFIDFVKPDGTKYKTPKLSIVDNVAIYDIPNGLVDLKGMLKMQIVLQNDEEQIWKSETKIFMIEDSINATDDIQEKEDFINQAQTLLNEIENGLTPTIGENGNWFVGDNDTGVQAQGPQGPQGFVVFEELTPEQKEELRGPQGLTATIEVGTIETLEPNQMAEVINSGNEHEAIFDFRLPRGEKGDTYKITDKDYENIAEVVEDNIQPQLNEIDKTSDEALEIAKSAESIAKGKSQATVFETAKELEMWLKDETNKGTHSTGDNLYIKQMWIDEEETIRQPDYWITEVLEEPNELGYYYEISDLGVEHPDLTNLLSKDEIKEKYLLITYEDETTETVKLVVYK